jgi:hypothetical protein
MIHRVNRQTNSPAAESTRSTAKPKADAIQSLLYRRSISRRPS